MENLLTVALEVHHAEENHHRHYQLAIGKDLFNHWTIAIRYGRVGQAGRELRYSASRLEELRTMVNDRLRRRLSAPRRIGCAYRLTEFNAAPGLEFSSFLQGSIFARFFLTRLKKTPAQVGRL